MKDRVERWMFRRADYQACFCHPDGTLKPEAVRVLADIARFSGGWKSNVKVSPVTGGVDPIALGVAEGRREVWLRILSVLRLKPEDALAAMEMRHD